jgi:DNA processing protein
MNVLALGDDEVHASVSARLPFGISSPRLPKITADIQTRNLLEQLETDPPPDIPGQQRADELFARVAWSRIAEPGDRAAGALIMQLGATSLLAHLVAGSTPGDIVAEAWPEHSDSQTVVLDVRSVRAGVDRWRPRLSRADTMSDVEHAVTAGLKLIVPGDLYWPESIKGLGEHAPLALWLRGDPKLLTIQGLAVVGARASSSYGENLTAEIVDGVCSAGASIISGAAFGIDAAAHRSALAAGGNTVAVLAGGADRPYPVAHTSLIDRIAQQGLVCSELIPGEAPTRWRFLQRNRIIAALAAGTLVTEAGIRSGSLNTAGHAAQLGRPLGAVPGPVSSGTSAGCHRLIRDYGAVLVTNAAEACELLELEITLIDESSPGPDRSPPLHRRLVDALPLRGSRSLQDAARLAGLAPDEARSTIAELEVLGVVKRVSVSGIGRASGDQWSLVSRSR